MHNNSNDHLLSMLDVNCPVDSMFGILFEVIQFNQTQLFWCLKIKFYFMTKKLI